MMKYLVTFLAFLFILPVAAKIQYKIVKDIPYISSTEQDAYRKDRCKLDVYYPENKTDFPTIIWFHGGGLTGGEKDIPREFMEQGIGIVAVNYRLSPKAKNPAYIKDAAEAVTWTFNNIANYGGSPELIFVSGHSAGGYLTLMLALDKQYLSEHDVDADKVMAYFPVSGQTTTHYTIRQERGLSQDIPLIDEYAPSNRIRKDTSPIILFSGDRNLELAARYEENAHLEAVLKAIGNKNVRLYEFEGFDHGTVLIPAFYLILQEVNKMVEKKKEK